MYGWGSHGNGVVDVSEGYIEIERCIDGSLTMTYTNAWEWDFYFQDCLIA